mgnify:CR=1 FL=1
MQLEALESRQLLATVVVGGEEVGSDKAIQQYEKETRSA